MPGFVWKVMASFPMRRWKEFVNSDRLLSDVSSVSFLSGVYLSNILF
jgi:hypothetical protein